MQRFAIPFLALTSILSFGDCDFSEDDDDTTDETQTEPTQIDETPTPENSLDSKYISVFHSCVPSASLDCSNPQNHTTYLAVSDNGTNWSLSSNFIPYKGSVPDLIRRKNTLYIYNPGQLHKFDISTNSWTSTSVPVSITNANGVKEAFVDPSPILVTEDGEEKIVLFYMYAVNNGSDPAGCASGEATCTKYFRSATEVAGSDGSSFVSDAGDRFAITLSSGQTASDPDIFQTPSGFTMYISRGMNVQATTSTSLRGSYQNISSLQNGMLISDNTGGVPAGYYDKDTQSYWTYVSGMENSLPVIKMAKTTSISSPLTSNMFSTVVSPSTVSGLSSTAISSSPGFELNKY